MENRKVLFLSAANSIHTVKWVNSLSENFEVHLIYCSNHKPNKDAIKEDVVLHELKYAAPLGYYFNSLQLKGIYNKIKPDVINVHYASGYGTLARISKIKPILLSVWGSDVYDFPNESNIKKKILTKNVLYADNIASTSRIMAKELKKQVPMLDKEIYITPFGVDLDKFKKIKNNGTKEKFIIGNIKTLNNAIYGIDVGILAIKHLIDKLIKNNETELANRIVLYIYGDGIDKNELEQMVKDNGLEDRVFLKGKIPNDKVPKALNDFDIFCITSNKESFGVAVVEAMACQLPVVATNADGFLEVMKNEKTGYIVQKGDVENIASKLEVLVKNEELRAEFGKNARQMVEENYNWKDNVDNMINIYNEINKRME